LESMLGQLIVPTREETPFLLEVQIGEEPPQEVVYCYGSY
jgi:hypothetical protein